MRYLLDTDTCIDLMRGGEAVVERLKMLTPDDCGISAITSFELFAGAAKTRETQRELEKIEALLDVVEELPFGPSEARRAGRLRASLQKAGTPVGAYDLLIAAQALVTNLVLVTANRREFGKVPELEIETWR